MLLEVALCLYCQEDGLDCFVDRHQAGHDIVEMGAGLSAIVHDELRDVQGRNFIVLDEFGFDESGMNRQAG